MSPQLTAYLYLVLAIATEVVGTSFLQKSEQFTKPLWTVLMGVFFLAAFFFLSLALRTIPLGVAYAVWSGLGVVLTAMISVYVFRSSLDAAALIGIALIIAGVVVMNLFSTSVEH